MLSEAPCRNIEGNGGVWPARDTLPCVWKTRIDKATMPGVSLCSLVLRDDHQCFDYDFPQASKGVPRRGHSSFTLNFSTGRFRKLNPYTNKIASPALYWSEQFPRISVNPGITALQHPPYSTHIYRRCKAGVPVTAQ